MMEDGEPFPTRQPDESAFTQVLKVGATPLTAVVDSTPESFRGKLSSRLEQILKNAVEQMMATFNDDMVENQLRIARAVSPTGSLDLSDERLSIVDEHVRELGKEVRHRTVVGSAVTGSLGFVGQFADLPAFYLYSIRTLGEIALNYGFDPRHEREQLYIMELLRIGHVPGRRRRLVQLDELSHQALDREHEYVHEASYALTGRSFSVASKQITALIVKRRMMAMVPLVGALVNAGFNWHLMGNILTTGQRGYKSKATLYRNRVHADQRS